MEKLSEVDFGESQELRVLGRWLKEGGSLGEVADRLVKCGQFDDFDFVLFDRRGVVVGYVEVKVRRTKFAQYGDALFPERKYRAAVLIAEHGLPCIGVVEYGCGSLVQVDLSARPSKFQNIARRDRPGMEPVPHVLYGRAKLDLLVAAEAA